MPPPPFSLPLPSALSSHTRLTFAHCPSTAPRDDAERHPDALVADGDVSGCASGGQARHGDQGQHLDRPAACGRPLSEHRALLRAEHGRGERRDEEVHAPVTHTNKRLHLSPFFPSASTVNFFLFPLFASTRRRRTSPQPTSRRTLRTKQCQGGKRSRSQSPPRSPRLWTRRSPRSSKKRRTPSTATQARKARCRTSRAHPTNQKRQMSLRKSRLLQASSGQPLPPRHRRAHRLLKTSSLLKRFRCVFFSRSSFPSFPFPLFPPFSTRIALSFRVVSVLS